MAFKLNTQQSVNHPAVVDGKGSAGLRALPDGWQEIALGLYGEGAADVEVRRALNNLPIKSWQVLLDRDPEFAAVIADGRQLSEAWWHAKGRAGVDDRNFNAHAYQFQMINRSRWSWSEPWYVANRSEVTGANGGPLVTLPSDRELARQIALILNMAANTVDGQATEIAAALTGPVTDVEEVKDGAPGAGEGGN